MIKQADDLVAHPSEYDFTLVLSGVDNIDPPIMDALFEAGCDDATPRLRSGTVSLAFARVAPDLKTAILSAIQEVRRAGIGADTVRVEHGGLVTLAASPFLDVVNCILEYQDRRRNHESLTTEVGHALGMVV